jgi:cytochrome c biogenesis protein CcmG/thiol:disulfide interchange protein DsbE
MAPPEASSLPASSPPATSPPPTRAEHAAVTKPATERVARADALTKPSPEGVTGADAVTKPAGRAGAASFLVTAPLKSIEGHRGGIEVKPFDLQSRIGAGRPVALLFWAPGFPVSETELVELSRFIKAQAPRYDLFAIAGKRDDQRPEMLWERFCMLEHPPDLPLLMDEGFALAKQLDVTDVPNLMLIDASGALVIAKLKGLEQVVEFSTGRTNVAQIILRVVLGAPPAPVKSVIPYYPATELLNHCAPGFTLRDVTTHRDVTFTGRSPNGRPTLLVFWSATCKHCQKEIPQLIAYVRNRPDAVNVVSVSFIKPDRPDGFSHRRISEAYIRTNGISWPVLDDSSGYADDLYRVMSTPTTFVLSPGGQVLETWFYPHENLAQTIEADLPRFAAANGVCRPADAGVPARAAFSVTAPDGTTVPLQSLTDRPSLVHLWATWCAPCRTELPDLMKFRRSLEGEGGRLVLVSVEDAAAAERIRAYGSGLDPSFESYRAPRGGLADLLDLAYSVPRTLVVARDGRVLKTLFGAQPWGDPSFQEKMRALLQLPAPRG